MAQGTLTIFDEAKLAMLNGEMRFDGTNVIKVAFISNTPTAADAAPTLATNTECAAGGNYTAGGFDLGTEGLSEAGGTVTYGAAATDIAMAKHASNPTNVFYGLIYDSTSTTPSDQAIGFVEINASGADGTVGAINVTWGASIFTLA